MNAPQSPHVDSAKEIVVGLIFEIARGVTILSAISIVVAALFIPGLFLGWSATSVASKLSGIDYDVAWKLVGTPIWIVASLVLVCVLIPIVHAGSNDAAK